MLKGLRDYLTGDFAPLRSALRRHGAVKLTALITLIAVVVSVTVMVVVATLLGSPINPVGLMVSILVPATVAPLFEYRLMSMLAKLDAAERKLLEMATTDVLTGAFNRRWFLETVETEWQRLQRSGVPFCLAILDMDEFKDINDSWGHEAGDQALIALTRLLKGHLRATDAFARWGGDEFVILFRDTTLEQASESLSRLMDLLKATTVDLNGHRSVLKLSAGVAAAQGASDFDGVLHQADEALYAVKASGGGGVKGR